MCHPEKFLYEPTPIHQQAATDRDANSRHQQASWPSHTMDLQLCHCQQNQLDKHGKPKLCICLDPSNITKSLPGNNYTAEPLKTYFTSFHKQKCSLVRRKNSFYFLKNRKLLEHRQTFTMANNMASSGLWENLYLPKLILTIDGPIAMQRGEPGTKVWDTNWWSCRTP